MSQRLGHHVDQVVTASGDEPLPFVALENIGSRTGSLLPDAELPLRVPEPTGMTWFREDDVLFGKLRPYLAKSWRADRTGVCSTELIVMRPRPTVDARWLGYLAQSDLLVEWAVATSEGVKMPRTSWEKLRLLELDAPSVDEQRAMADYLDAEISRIDAIVDARRQAAELAALRLDVSTRQLVGTDREGQPYGTVPLRRRWQVIDCKHRTPAYELEGYPIVSPGDATPGRLDLSRCTRFVGQDDFNDLAEGQRRPRRGDVIYTRNASIGIASYIDTDEPFSMGQDVCILRSADQDQRYLTYVLNTLGMDQLEEQKIGSTFSRINVARVLGLSVPCPPAAEQRRIADQLDGATTRTSALLAGTQRQMDLLLERRQALITAAVTGQLEIPGAAA